MRLDKIFFLTALPLVAGTLLYLYQIYENPRCINEMESRIVDGESLNGLIASGTRVDILWGYYACNKLRRGDLVVVQLSDPRHPIPLIKLVKGVPGDQFSLIQNEKGEWRLRVNGEWARTAQGEPYHFSKSRAAFLQQEQDRRGGIIPKDYGLLLGNVASGSMDSTYFGLIPIQQLIGKATCPDC